MERAFDPLKDGFVNYCGIVIDKKGNGFCEGHCTIEERHLNPWNMAHGGLTFTMMDTVAGNAVRSLGDGTRSTVTLNSSVHFMQPVREGLAICRANVVRNGGKIAVVESCIYDENETLLAKAAFEFYYLS